MTTLLRLEWLRVARSPGALLAVSLVLVVGGFAAWSGNQRTEQMIDAIEVAGITHATQFERVIARYADDTEAGEPLYYLAFPAGTPPSEWSGLFQGQRDVNPWNHRVRLLALEGQLYDSETGNPASQAAGPLDVGFVLIVLLPLLVILLTYDLRSSEEEAGTWRLVQAQAQTTGRTVAAKIGARALWVGSVAGVVLAIGVALNGAPLDRAAAATVVTIGLYTAVWFAGSLAIALRSSSSTTSATVLAGVWTVSVAAGPAVLNVLSAVTHPMPEALELTVLQREGYHASWDRPVGETMEQFYRDYPDFARYEVPSEEFTWAWYYAMNHRGDQQARQSAVTYEARLRAREEWARRWSVLFPPVAAQLALDRIAGTDVSGHLQHVHAVRDYHERLKGFFYPHIFVYDAIPDVDWSRVPAFQPAVSEPVSPTGLGAPVANLAGWLLLTFTGLITGVRSLGSPSRSTPRRQWSAVSTEAAQIASLVLLLLATPGMLAGQQETARLGSAIAIPGTVAHGWLEVPAAADSGTSLPVTVLRGTTNGPVVGIIAGVHGSEYTPILASGRLSQIIDPGELSGTLLIVHAANPPAFYGRTIYTGPVDGKNLNRVFPGDRSGSLSERIADVLVREVMRRSDFVLDLHSGDANEDLRPYVGYYGQAGGDEVIARSRAMAHAFGAPFVVRFPQTGADAGIYAGGAGVELGRPAIDVEIGGRGRASGAEVDSVVDGVVRVIRHLGMLPPAPEPSAPSAPPVEIDERTSARSPIDGAFLPAVSPGEWVAEGAPLGSVRTLHGDVEQTVPSPASGVVLVILATPPVGAGEWVATIGQLPSG